MSIEAMKQALKFMHAAQFSVEDYIATEAALVAAIEQAEKPNEDYERGFVDGMQEQMKSSVDRAVNAMCKRGKEPYDQTALELCNECGWKAIIPGDGCLVCARQKAKPVWIPRTNLEHAQREPSMCRVEPTKRLPDFVPLYAAPRQWVGLTDEEVDEFYWISALTVEAIEAKLKEKNT